jgi:hypothetical protein
MKFIDWRNYFIPYLWGRNKQKEYIQNTIECINLIKKNNLTFFDITELFSKDLNSPLKFKAILTVRASNAYRIYSNNKIIPRETINGWSNF